MTSTRVMEVLVGLFMVLGLLALFMLAMQVSNLTSSGNGQTYVLKASFEDIGGLKVRSPVKASGVVVGRVADIHYDQQKYVAVVSMEIDTRYDQFPVDTAAAILTAGLLGEQYVGLDVGAEDDVLKNGDVITLTQSSLVLEKLISKFLYNKTVEE